VSRVKRIYLYTLKNNDWVEIGSGAFDTGMKDPTKTDFKKLVIKTGKKKFKVCDFVDGKITWQSFEMK
jgi:hypothetical protein